MPNERIWPDPARTEGVWDDPAEPGPPGRVDGVRPERDRPPEPGRAAAVDDLLRLGADFAPSLAAEGADRVLGPFADDAPRELRRHAVALAAFLVPEDADRSPVERAIHELPGDVAQGLRCARWAPLAPWRLHPAGPGRVTLEPLLPMGTGVPPAPLDWPGVPAVDGADGEVVFARVAPAHGGWGLVAGIAAPPPPPGWLLREARALPAGRPPTTEGTLRARGHVLLRRWLEHRWATTTTTRMPTR